MARYKVPSQAASGADTFSDSLVGNQFTTGSDQMTNANFAIDRAIPEKDSKEFITEPFTDFVTLDTIGREEQPQTSDGTKTSTKDSTITFNNDKNNADRSLYGSLKQRLGVEVTDIISKFPAAFYVDGTTPMGVPNYTASGITYNSQDVTTTFYIQQSLIYNPLDVVIVEPQSNTLPESDNDIRNFFSSFTKYGVIIDDISYNILTYTEPDSNNQIKLKVKGNCFNGVSEYSENYIIRPNNGVVEEFYRSLNDIQTVLLNRTSDPIFNAGFDVPKEGEYDTEITTIYVNWPVSRDGWNIQTEGVEYASYIDKLSSIGEDIDGYKSNLVIRFLTSPQLYEFDTEEHKIEAIFQIYGQSFDKVKKFIDNIAYMRNVSYDGINNLPDALLKNLCETLGLSSVDLFDEKSLEDALYTRHNTQYAGVPTGTNLIGAEYEFYRRILVNLAHLYKSKGTRNAIEFFLKFIGAPEAMIRIDEYVYTVTGSLPSKDVEEDISKALVGTYVSYSASYNTGTGIYDLVQVTGSTTLTRQEYPVDNTTGLPRKIKDPTGEMFFEKGAGWYRRTLEHRSPDILDSENSDLTSRVKTIKTKAKPFTYGEDYFDTFRTLPGLDYGYDLTPVIDNKKSDVIESETEADRTLNRKNINVFLSGDRAIDYDIYRKSRNIPTSFSILTPQTGVTFAEFLETALNEALPNANMVKYEKFYTTLEPIYYSYMNTVGFTPYHYIAVEEFINRMSPYWVKIIEQFIPATTLWLGGNVLENGLFNRSKFMHHRPRWFDVNTPDCDFVGSVTIIPCPSVTPTPTPTISVTPSRTPSVTPTRTPTRTPSSTPATTPTPTRTVTPTPTVTPSTSHIPVEVITLWAVGGDYISKSTDDGQSWTQQYDTSGTYLNAVSFLDANTGFAFGGSSPAKAFKTLNGGTSWFDNSSSLPSIASSRTIWGATHELSTDIYVGGNLSMFLRFNGSTWSDVSKGTSHNSYYMYALSSSTVLSTTSLSAAVDYGLRTTNSGGSWSEPATFPQDQTVRGVAFNGTNGIMCTSRNATTNKIYRSSDSGASWGSGQSGPTTAAMNSVAFPTATVAYVGGVDQSGIYGHMWKTTNGGVSWSDITGNFPASTVRRINVVRFVDANRGWIGTDFSDVWYTTNGGSTWTGPIEADLNNSSVEDMMMIVEYI